MRLFLELAGADPINREGAGLAHYQRPSPGHPFRCRSIPALHHRHLCFLLNFAEEEFAGARVKATDMGTSLCHGDRMINQPPDRSPLYARVESALGERIAAGALAPGDRLPSEDELAAEFAVSRTTVRSAIQSLLQRGLVEIRRGRGTFVAAPKIVQELTNLTGFVEDMEALGREATAKLLDQRAIPADPAVARHLMMTQGTPVTRIRRVRLADGMPLSYDETFLPTDLGEKIVADNLETEPIFALLERKYETPLVEAEYQLEAVVADAAIAEALRVPTGSPIFLIERTSYAVGGRAVDYERLHYRGDQIRFITRLARKITPSRSES
jgi:GntR family transcriptional regulator